MTDFKQNAQVGNWHNPMLFYRFDRLIIFMEDKTCQI